MSEERAATVLHALEAELPPSTVDIDRAVRVGRRRERTRRGLAAGALAGVTVVAAVGAVTVLNGGDPVPRPATGETATATTTATNPASRTCAAERLPGPADGKAARPDRISPNGRFVVGSTDDRPVPVVWADGAATAVTVPAGVTATPHAVNDTGMIVGLARRADRTLPFVVRDGVYSELPLPAGTQGAAHAVDTRGDIVGEVTYANGDSKAVLWKGTPATVTPLASTSRWAAAHAIGDDGTVFGSLDDGATPYAWGPDGAGRAMPGAAQGKAMGVSGDYVYGHAGSATPTGTKEGKREGGQPRWVRWQLSTGTVVELTGLSANAVDATGGVVGSVRKGAPPSVTAGPARWHDGTVTELPGPDGAVGTGEVLAVSRDGTRLVGWTGAVGSPVPTVWRC